MPGMGAVSEGNLPVLRTDSVFVFLCTYDCRRGGIADGRDKSFVRRVGPTHEVERESERGWTNLQRRIVVDCKR
ncbi:hypothetical protein FF1_035191 [Malus domestica]